MKNKSRVVYYKDEANDDFASFETLKKVTIDENYVYEPKNVFYKMFSFVVYYLLAKPILYIVTRCFQNIAVKGRKNLKKLKKTGYVIYCNHTRFCDAYIMPVRVTGFKRTYVISGKDAFTLPVVNVLVKALGAIPIADNLRGMMNMNKAIDKLLIKHKALVIYPEAHIWQYYTGLRAFPVTSFKIPARNNVPVVPVATTFKKRMFLGKELKPKMTYTIGEPIYPLQELSIKENAEYLKNKVYSSIYKSVNVEDNYTYIKYIKQTVEMSKQTEDSSNAEIV